MHRDPDFSEVRVLITAEHWRYFLLDEIKTLQIESFVNESKELLKFMM